MGFSDRMAMRYLREDSFGVPGSKPLQTLLVTSETLTTNFTTIESETVIGDRQVRDLVRTGRLAQGDINFELIYGNLDDLLCGALANEWVSNVLENDSDLISFAFEKDFTDLGLLYAFLGCRVGGLTLNFAVQQQIRGTLSVMGKGGVFASASASIGAGSPAAAVDNPMMVSLSKLVLEEGGQGITAATAFSFQTANNLRERRVLGSDDLVNLALGTFRVTGTLDAYFEDRRFLDKLIADTPTDFEIVTEDDDGNAYTWIFPRIKFTGTTGPNNQGRNTDVMTQLQWTAFRDPSTGITMRVER